MSIIRQPTRDFMLDVAMGRVLSGNNQRWYTLGKFGSHASVWVDGFVAAGTASGSFTFSGVLTPQGVSL